MHRITHDDLLAIIAVTLKTAPTHAKRGLLSESENEIDASIDELAGRIASQIDNKGRMVIEAELRPDCVSLRDDEPDPCKQVITDHIDLPV